MAIDRLIQPEENQEEQAPPPRDSDAPFNNELSLRPLNFKQYIGQ